MAESYNFQTDLNNVTVVQASLSPDLYRKVNSAALPPGYICICLWILTRDGAEENKIFERGVIGGACLRGGDSLGWIDCSLRDRMWKKFNVLYD